MRMTQQSEGGAGPARGRRKGAAWRVRGPGARGLLAREGATKLAVEMAALAMLAAPMGAFAASAQPAGLAPLQALSSLEVPPYMGTWFQVALFPNRFQAQCVSDTTATYRQLPDGSVEVVNRCRTADGRVDEAMGRARPTGVLRGTTLAPAQLEVSFLPEWIRWLPVGWGTYWVIQLAPDARYAVVSEPSRQYLWVLSRTPRLTPEDETAIRSRLIEQGFAAALARWQSHPHSPSSR